MWYSAPLAVGEAFPELPRALPPAPAPANQIFQASLALSEEFKDVLEQVAKVHLDELGTLRRQVAELQGTGSGLTLSAAAEAFGSAFSPTDAFAFKLEELQSNGHSPKVLPAVPPPKDSAYPMAHIESAEVDEIAPAKISLVSRQSTSVAEASPSPRSSEHGGIPEEFSISGLDYQPITPRDESCREVAAVLREQVDRQAITAECSEKVARFDMSLEDSMNGDYKNGVQASEDIINGVTSMYDGGCAKGLTTTLSGLPLDGLEDLHEYNMDVVLKWHRIAEGVFNHASTGKKHHQLHDTWIMQDQFVQKMVRRHSELDMFSKSHRYTHTAVPRQSRVAAIQSRVGTGIISGSSFGRSQDMMSDEDSRLMGRAQADSLRRSRIDCSCIMLNPQSPIRVSWMFLGMMLMLYDLIVLPMQSFDLPEEEGFLFFMQWAGQIFWTADIAVSCITGVYVNSELVLDIFVVLREYFFGWFIFDVMVVLPLWIVILVDTGGKSGGEAAKGTSIFKYIRMLRFMRLLRLAKFEHVLAELLATINSANLLLCLGIMKLMSMLILLNHINACMWYAVGKYGKGGWVDKYNSTPLIYQYLTSMHWAITQFQGTSEITPTVGGGREVLERFYAVTTVVFAMMIMASFVSALTNMILQLQSLRDERNGMQRAVRQYLNDNNISMQLSVRVKKYIEWKQRMARKSSGGGEVIKHLPMTLQMDVMEEVFSPFLVSRHPLFIAFYSTHPRFFRILCYKALHQMTPAPHELIFNPGDQCSQMYFVASGILKYCEQGETLNEMRKAQSSRNQAQVERPDMSTIKRNEYLSEPVLWTRWEHRGGLMGISDSALLCLAYKDFGELMSTHPQAHVSAILYARSYLAGLNRFGKVYSDIIDSLEIITEQEDDGGVESASMSVFRTDN